MDEKQSQLYSVVSLLLVHSLMFTHQSFGHNGYDHADSHNQESNLGSQAAPLLVGGDRPVGLDAVPTGAAFLAIQAKAEKLVADRCNKCHHTEGFLNGKLTPEFQKRLFKSKNGESLLVMHLEGKRKLMPPRQPFSPEEIKLVKAWVEGSNKILIEGTQDSSFSSPLIKSKLDSGQR